MERGLCGIDFIESALSGIRHAGINIWTYEAPDCEMAFGFHVDVQSADSHIKRRVTVNLEGDDDYDVVKISTPQIELDSNDTSTSFDRDSYLMRYGSKFSRYFEERLHSFHSPVTVEDDHITGIQFVLSVSRTIGEEIFIDEDSLSAFEYINRLANLMNDISSLLTATIVGFGDFDKMFKDILRKHKLGGTIL